MDIVSEAVEVNKFSLSLKVFQSKLDHLPGQPGCYLFRNAKREILYVGKAAVLADRVRSYFQIIASAD